MEICFSTTEVFLGGAKKEIVSFLSFFYLILEAVKAKLFIASVSF